MSKKKRKFLPLLESLLENTPKDIIGWSDDGKSFTVNNPKKFEQDVLGKYFAAKNLSSFIRQLNFYGFTKVVPKEASKKQKKKKHWQFQHKHFVRDRPDLIALIKRKKYCDPDTQQPRSKPSADFLSLQSKVVELQKTVGDLQEQIKHLGSALSFVLGENYMQVNDALFGGQDMPKSGKKRKRTSDAASLLPSLCGDVVQDDMCSFLADMDFEDSVDTTLPDAESISHQEVLEAALPKQNSCHKEPDLPIAPMTPGALLPTVKSENGAGGFSMMKNGLRKPSDPTSSIFSTTSSTISSISSQYDKKVKSAMSNLTQNIEFAGEETTDIRSEALGGSASTVLSPEGALNLPQAVVTELVKSVLPHLHMVLLAQQQSNTLNQSVSTSTTATSSQAGLPVAV